MKLFLLIAFRLPDFGIAGERPENSATCSARAEWGEIPERSGEFCVGAASADDDSDVERANDAKATDLADVDVGSFIAERLC